MKKIVVIGAGYAGILTAKHLEKKLRKNQDVEITIIDKNSYHTMLTELHEVAAGRVDEESIRLELTDIFAHRKVNIVLDEITTTNFETKQVIGKDGTYDYDYLVIATGSRPTFFNTIGHEFAFSLWSYDDAIVLKEQILHCFRKAACTKDKLERVRLLTFSIVGSGFTGVEMAGELGEYKTELCRKFHIPVEEVTINIIDIASRILSMYPDKLVSKVEKKFNQLGVDIYTDHAVEEIGQNYIVAGGKKIDSYTTIWAAGIEGSSLAKNIDSLAQEGRGRFKTNKYLQSVDNDNVYIAGDNIFYVPEGDSDPVPQMVENAEKSSKCVAHNIINDMNEQELIEYKPKFSGSMLCVGGRYGVAYIGSNPDKMKCFSGFIAMFLKHFINLIYFIEVLGLHKWYSYAKHEFFQVKNRRSFVGGHLSNSENAPTIFLVPLRLFLGLMWLMSGISKLPGVFNDWRTVTAFPSKAMRFGSDVGNGAAKVAEEASDAVSGATEVVGGATDGAAEVVLTGFDGFAHSMGQIFELKAASAAPTPGFIDEMMNWMYQTFFWEGADGFTLMASIFQTGVIFAEIIIGIMFILGFLTPIASIVSVILMLMIYSSGWSYISIFFFGLAGLACFLSGNSLGLDYYVLPWLDKKLRTWRFTKKWYLYFK